MAWGVGGGEWNESCPAVQGLAEAGLFPKEIAVLRFLMKFRFSAPQEPGTGNQEYGNQEPGTRNRGTGNQGGGEPKTGISSETPLDPRAVISLDTQEP